MVGDLISWVEIIIKFRIQRISNNLFLIRHVRSNTQIYFPFKKINRSIWTQLRFMDQQNGYFDHMKKKYLYTDFEIPSNWTIVDCGSYVGGFSISISKDHSGKIYCVEPSPSNFEALRKNIELFSATNNIDIFNYGFGETNMIADMSISGSGQDDSLLGVDDSGDDISQIVKVEIKRFDQFADEKGIDLDKCFLKLEAEGYEIEAIKGLGVCKPLVISVDISAERLGESPLQEVSNQLRSIGYDLIETNLDKGEPVTLLAFRKQIL